MNEFARVFLVIASFVAASAALCLASDLHREVSWMGRREAISAPPEPPAIPSVDCGSEIAAQAPFADDSEVDARAFLAADRTRSDQERGNALAAIGAAGRPSAGTVKALEALLGDRPAIATAAAATLGALAHIGAQSALSSLLENLTAQDESVREAVARALSGFNVEKAAAALCRCMARDPSARVRSAAAVAAAQHRDTRTAWALGDRLAEDADADVRTEALASLRVRAPVDATARAVLQLAATR